jgi:His/Glu/Gln/Arg/opine family amino acid ABC transporter permease subunit
MSYRFDWAPIWQNRQAIFDGLTTTILLSLAGLILALILGLLVGTMGASRSRLARTISAVFVECMRNVPLLIHMYVWYMALAFLKLPPFFCAVLGLTFYSSAYVAEVVRAGIGGIPNGQMQAAEASGMRTWQARLLVIYPQALRNIAPSLASLSTQLIKDSSLASVIAVAELTYYAGTIEGQTFRTFEVYITLALLYLALVTIVSRGLMAIPGLRDAPKYGKVADA